MAGAERPCGACDRVPWKEKNEPTAFWRLGKKAVEVDGLKWCFFLVFLKIIMIFPHRYQ